MRGHCRLSCCRSPIRQATLRRPTSPTGLTSSVTADLSRIRDAFIVPVSTAVGYRDKAVSVKQIGQDLGVRFVLQGSVMASGHTLRINAYKIAVGAQGMRPRYSRDL
jgi:TolB-like protein